ncbi:MCE family protein [Actinocorallia sp. B10E7]|uniref:MCE family protein n=1 Tax=Actinocorallia sp. B10E7 TaxID=3153558 RepID=UPI00325F338D
MRRLLAGLLLLTTAGCGLPGLDDVTLPGGADLGDHPYTVHAEFADVLNLVPQAAVKVNDVPVGRVTGVDLAADGWTARVSMIVNGGVRLPADAQAQVKQSSLLGEKFIQLSAPPAGAGTLTGGAVIPVERTNRNTEVEEVFGALSLLLNGGGISQLRTITTELNKAVDGNEPAIRSLLGQVSKLASQLDGNKKAITDAIDGMNRLSLTLARHKGEAGDVLDHLGPGLDVLADQRAELVGMLEALEDLSRIATRTIDRSKKDLIEDLKALEPTLKRLADSGRDLPRALEVLFTYPFTDAVLPAVKGDYLNSYLTVAAVEGTELIPPISAPSPEKPAEPEAQP